MKIVFTFPGQGSQVPGMLDDVQEYVKMAEKIVGISILDTEKALYSTLSIQLSLFIKEVAIANKLLEQQIYPDFVAGHSIGAFAAAVISGVLSFEDALKLIWHRGKRMEEIYPAGYGMGVITGLTEREVREVVNRAKEEDTTVFLSNINSELQIAVSGSLEGIEKAFLFAKQLGAEKTTRLKVPVPSHSPLMNEIAQELSSLISRISLNNPNIPYLANRTGRILRDKEKIAEDLSLNVAYPVRWNDMTTICVESGADCFIELPPGHILTRLVGKAHKDTRQIVVEEVGLQGTHYLINKWKGAAG